MILIYFNALVSFFLFLILLGYAKAFEAIPRQLAQNAGFDATDILSLLRKKHSKPGMLLFFLYLLLFLLLCE
jgi:hypothetical protein